MSPEPPEEPQLRSQHRILSPTSPKPMHFPTPTNMTVLQMQMDVGFNQTEAHMNDPAMHNTEVRPDFWRDPNEQPETTATDHASPYSTGGDEDAEGDDGVGEEQNESTPIQGHTMKSEDFETGAVKSGPNEVIASAPQSSNENFQAQQNEPPQPPLDPAMPSPGVSVSNPDTPPAQSEPTNVSHFANMQPDSDPVDVQSLLDTLQGAQASMTSGTPLLSGAAPEVERLTVPVPMSTASQHETHQTQPGSYAAPPGVDSASSSMSASALGAPPSGLPPRPPPQEQPLIHPNYVYTQHIRDYHPHAAHPAFQPTAKAGSQSNVADPSSNNLVPPVQSPATGSMSAMQQLESNASLAGTTHMHSGMPAYAPGADTATLATGQTPGNGFATSSYNLSALQYPSAGNSQMESKRETKLREGEQVRHADRPWEAEVQRKYDHFIEEERKYVSEGRWEQFPQGSRLFVGNLSSEKVTKRDIFDVFHTYGELAQISIKQAYGFVQFLRTEDCMRALEGQQGTQIQDKKIHLEVSKPQKNRPQNNQRRSRSPPDSGRGRASATVDRYVSGSRNGNGRDSYRSSYRSPSPRGYRDRRDDRYRARSRSPGMGRGGRYRSPSPRRDTNDDLPLPKRAPHEVPDVQIIVLDTLDRDFISWVERAFSSRSVRVDVLLLSPRLSEQAVVRRQIVEGVAAVSKLTRQNQNTGKIGLQIFDRRGGANNVKFEEYDGLDPNVAVELVLRAKSTHAAPAPSYGGYGGQQYRPSTATQQTMSQYGDYGAPQPSQPAYGQPQGYLPTYAQTPAQTSPAGIPGVPPNLQHLITNLDPNNLQTLLSAMSGTPQSANSFPGGQHSAVAAQLQSNPALAGYLQQQQQQQQPQQVGRPGSTSAGAVNMQDILARLGNSGR